jgi:DNA-binding NarL/FixJ family response regulator
MFKAQLGRSASFRDGLASSSGAAMIEVTRPRFLMVDDDAAVQRCLARVVRRHGEFVAADTFQRAAYLLSDGSMWAGFFFDVELPDGSGLDLLAQARDAHPITPAMVLTGNNRDSTANAAYDLRAHYVIKPVATKRIEQFLKDAVSLESHVSRALRQWTDRYGLSEAEADVLRRSALGESQSVIATARGVSRETIKTQVATLLGKTGDESLQTAAGRLLRDVAKL